MALSVVLVHPGEENSWKNIGVVSFSCDGYYKYLSGYWPASSSTGKVIDLYDDAIFKGPNLAQLRGCLSRAKEGTSIKPELWHEQTGVDRYNKPVLHKVKKAELLRIINTMQQAIARAEEEGLEVHFLGD